MSIDLSKCIPEERLRKGDGTIVTFVGPSSISDKFYTIRYGRGRRIVFGYRRRDGSSIGGDPMHAIVERLDPPASSRPSTVQLTFDWEGRG